jgi:flagellar basal-body rod protein FlgG
MDAFYIAATGMQAQQLNVDTIANNLANVNTTGFKKNQVNFIDLMVHDGSHPLQRVLTNIDAGLLGSISRTGAGVGVASMSKSFTAGDLKQTDSAFDIAIQGDGFLEVIQPDGSSAYTRGGTLKVRADGQLVTQDGNTLKPGINIPDNAQKLTITSDGHVQIQVAGQSNPVDAGQLELVRFASPGALIAMGNGLYINNESSGEPIAGKAGQEGLGQLQQGFLEGSNVKMVDEMVNLMVAQRAYEASVKIVQASDELLSMVNNLRK